MCIYFLFLLLLYLGKQQQIHKRRPVHAQREANRLTTQLDRFYCRRMTLLDHLSIYLFIQQPPVAICWLSGSDQGYSPER